MSERCKTCGGKGLIIEEGWSELTFVYATCPDCPEECKTCGGTGVVHVPVDMGGCDGVQMTMIEDDHCLDCEGTGERETSDGD